MKKASLDFDLVRDRFNKKALESPDLRSVLDFSQSESGYRSNILHDYFSRKYVRKYLEPGKNDVILDFGCGIGRLTSYFSPMVKKIVGVDSAEKMVEVATNMNLKTNVNYYGIDYLFSFSQPEFNKVFTHWVFAHISNENLFKYALQFSKILVPGGKIVFFEQVEGCESKISDTYYRRNSTEYIDIFQKAGFHLVRSKKVYRYPSYSRAIINRLSIPVNPFLSVLYLIEKWSINRKPELAAYYTEAFVFEKPILINK